MHAFFKLQYSVEVEQTSPSKLNGLLKTQWDPGMGSGLHQGPWNSSTLCSQGKNIQFHKHLSLHPVSAPQVAISSEWLIYICDGTARNNKGTAVWPGLEPIWVRFPRTGKMSNMWHFFFIFDALLWPNGWIFSSFLNCSEEIMSVRP